MKKYTKFLSRNMHYVDYSTLKIIAFSYANLKEISIKGLSYNLKIDRTTVWNYLIMAILLDLFEELEKEFVLSKLYNFNSINARKKEEIYNIIVEQAIRRSQLLNERATILADIKELELAPNNSILILEEKKHECIILQRKIIHIEEGLKKHMRNRKK